MKTLKTFVRATSAKRMTYFRTHKSTGARSAFVKYENATLGGFGLQLAVGSAPPPREFRRLL